MRRAQRHSVEATTGHRSAWKGHLDSRGLNGRQQEKQTPKGVCIAFALFLGSLVVFSLSPSCIVRVVWFGTFTRAPLFRNRVMSKTLTQSHNFAATCFNLFCALAPSGHGPCHCRHQLLHGSCARFCALLSWTWLVCLCATASCSATHILCETVSLRHLSLSPSSRSIDEASVVSC